MSTLRYQRGLEGVQRAHLEEGFFVGWPDAPDAATHLEILEGSSEVIIAWEHDQVVGFINALSDGRFMAFIPLLEVRQAWQHRGIGRELVRRMLEVLRDHYAIDLVCDEALVPFYERSGMQPIRAMALRHYDNQSGRGGERA